MEESYQSYLRRFEKKVNREEILKKVAIVFSTTATLLFTLYQLLFGLFSGGLFADVLALVVSFLLLLHGGALVFNLKNYPEFLYSRIQKISQPLATAIASFFIAILFIIIFPISALQKKRLQKYHPSTYYWLKGGVELSSWREKSTYRLHQQKNTVLATLWYFFTNKNYFLLIVAVMLIIIATAMLLSASPVISPFIYPIF